MITKAKTTRKMYTSVTVQSWERSHYTGNGLAVHKFVIETPQGLTIEGKTAPNNGFYQSLPRDPKTLINVEISTTPSGRVVMTAANA